MLNRLWLFLLFIAAAPALAQPQPRTLEGRDLFSLEVASEPQISPDGRWIAYVRRSADIMTDRMRPTIWLVDTRSGRQMPLVAGPGNHTLPRWSPSGDRIAYISTAEGGTAQLFVRWMESGEAVRITGLPASPTATAWSPDGRHIAYSMLVPEEGTRLGAAPPRPEGAQWAEPLQIITNVTYRRDGQGYLRPGYNQIFVVSSDGGAPRQLSQGNFHHGGPISWTADGRSVLISANRSADWEREPFKTEIYALDAASGRLDALTDRPGPDQNPVASPDGRLIAYVGAEDRGRIYENSVLFVMNRDGSNRRALTEALDRSVESPLWAQDGRSVYVAFDDRGVRRVARVGLDGSIRTVVEGLSGSDLDRPYAGGTFSVSRDGAIAFTGGTATRPADVHLQRGGNRTQLTRLNSDLLENRRLGHVRHIQARSSHDGRAIDAWLTLPANYVEGQRYPLILEIHGGPIAAYGPHFSTDNQLYAAAGNAVLSVNPRGSSSYGAEFVNLIQRAYPGNDYDDLMSAVDAAIAAGVADPERLFVTGGSGGGVLTAWTVGKTNRFRAAAAQKPVIDWASFGLTTDSPVNWTTRWFGQLPWENSELYWRQSPLSLVGNVRTPTLVVVGGEDYRTPVSEAEQYYTALRLAGVPTALVKIPGASHSFAVRPSQSAARISAILAWFQRYRDGNPAPTGGN